MHLITNLSLLHNSDGTRIFFLVRPIGGKFFLLITSNIDPKKMKILKYNMIQIFRPGNGPPWLTFDAAITSQSCFFETFKKPF